MTARAQFAPTEAQDTERATLRENRRRWRNWDIVSAVSFCMAGIFGAASIINTINAKFYHAVVQGYNESPTIFSEFLKKYVGPEGKFAQNNADFSKVIKQFENGEIGKEAFKAAREVFKTAQKTDAKAVRDGVAKIAKDHLDIPTKGPIGYTLGTVKRWNAMGMTAQRETALGFAVVLAVAVAAIGVLRSNKHAIDRIEERLEQQDAEIARGRR